LVQIMEPRLKETNWMQLQLKLNNDWKSKNDYEL
jgi:hypothetical protein